MDGSTERPFFFSVEEAGVASMEDFTNSFVGVYPFDGRFHGSFRGSNLLSRKLSQKVPWNLFLKTSVEVNYDIFCIIPNLVRRKLSWKPPREQYYSTKASVKTSVKQSSVNDSMKASVEASMETFMEAFMEDSMETFIAFMEASTPPQKLVPLP